MALGIISFCLLAVMGLLPMGLKSVKDANMESASANAINLISSAIRDATTNSGVYTAAGVFSNMKWSLGSSSSTFSTNLSLSGQPTNAASARLVAHVEVTPPNDTMTTGHASISIAWPYTATWSNNVWMKSDGSVSSSIIFLPKQ